ncbi:MAG: pyruvate formate lyase family protein [Armatimonadota bacterium]|nr:pyruvate formate lyase family protein [Armatimonadota bacterium]
MVDLREPYWLEWLREKDPFSAAYLRCEDPRHVVRLAHALRAWWSATPALIEADDRLVGRLHAHGVAGFAYGSGIFCRADTAAQLAAECPRWAGHLQELVAFWRSWQPASRVHLPEDEALMSGNRVYWAGWGGHTVLGFDQLLAEGTEGIRARIQRAQAGESDPEKRAFRDALLVVCDGLDAFAARYARAARNAAAGEGDPRRRAELEAIAARCEWVPRRGARTFPEALQSFWFVHLLDGCDSPGRIDQFLLPYYQHDREAGLLSAEEAQAWMDHLWKRFNDTRSWNVCVGGLLPDGRDGTNDLTYMAIEATRRCQKVAPNLSLRVHPGTPRALWQKAIECIETGVGMPALYNDEVLIPALTRYGIPVEEARDYALNGCCQVDIQGRSHMGLEDGELNLLKCLELALHDGFDPVQQRQVGPRTGNARAFTSFEEVWSAYTAQVEFFTRRMIAAANAVQQAHAETSPNLLRSLFVADCIEKGVDFKAGGARYNHGQILTQGIANTADSLAAIRRLVFEERVLTMDTLLDALDGNFPDEGLRQLLLRRAPKFGNDEPEVDALAARVIDHFYRHLNTYRTWRGGVYGGGSIVFVRAPLFGSHVGATPDGRRAGAPLADSVGPSQGRDTHGPTAMFQSVARVPQVLAQSAYVLNVKFPRSVVRQKREEVIALFQAYFAAGGQQIQANVVDRETLLRAREHPEEHAGLVVRVGGYSDYFVRLSPALQEDIIARTEQVL